MDKDKVFMMFILAGVIFTFLGVVIGVTFFHLQPSQILINSDTADARQGQTQEQLESQHDWIIEGNSVYINDSNVFLDFTPHTSNNPMVTLISKKYSGDIDLVAGFDTSLVRPEGASIPYKTNVTRNYTCEYEMNYTTNPNYFWCYRNITYQDNQTNETITTNEIEVVFEHSFDSGDLETQTAYWDEEVTRFNDISDNFKAIDIEYQNYSKWYYMQRINIEAGKEYKLRLDLRPVDPFTNQEFKYFFGIKPSGETLREAIDNEHFYFIDPWTASLETDLVSWYNLEETSGDVVDIWGSNNGTNDGATRGVTGKINNAFDFDGTNYWTEDSGNLDWLGNSGQDFTFNFWIKTSTGENIVLDKRFSNTQTPLLTDLYGGSNDKLRWRLYDGGTIVEPTSTTTITDGNWHHIVFVRDTTNNRAILYVDGNEEDNLPENLGDISNTERLIFGGGRIGADYKGKIDEVGIWSRALTSSEISDLYNSGDGTNPLDTGGGTDNPPSITLNSPTTADYTTIQNITINCTASDDKNLTSVSYSVNGTTKATNSSGINNTDYVWELLNVGDGNYNISCTAEDNESQTTSTANATINIDTTPFIEFSNLTLANETEQQGDYFYVEINLTETYFANLTIYLYNSSGLKDERVFTNATRYANFTSLTDEIYKTNATVWTTTGQSNSTPTRTFTVDGSPPELTDTYNLTDIFTLNSDINSTWSYNASDPHIDSCYYNTSENSTYTIITCNSTIYTTWSSGGNKTVQYCANDTYGNENCSVDYVYVDYLTYSQAEEKDPVGEGMNVVFNLSLNLIDTPTADANFWFNGSQYSPDTISRTQNKTYFTKTIYIQDGWGNSTGIVYDWWWNYSIDGLTTDDNTSIQDITVYNLAVDDCTDYGEIILNMSLKDEAENTFITNGSDSSIELDLDLTSLGGNETVTIEYSNTWSDDEDGIAQVCVPSGLINNSQYRIDFTISYNADGYVQEFYYLDDGVLNSSDSFDSQTSKNIDLYDLLADDSTTFLFKFYDEENLEVPNAIVHVYRNYIGEGIFREVERGKQDDNGETHIHLVEEDVIYYFVISKNGEILYQSSTYNAKCLDTPCQIELEASGEFEPFNTTNWDLVQGGNYTITSDAATRQVTMDFVLNSTRQVNLSLYKYDPENQVNELIANDQTYASSGTLTATAPLVAGNTTFYAVAYIDDEWITSRWVNFDESGLNYFSGIGLSMAVLMIMLFVLMGASQGIGSIVLGVFGIVVAGFLKLIQLDYYAIIGLCCAAAIIVWKLVQRRKR